MSTKTKPLAEWTLGDLKEHCTKEGDCKKPTVCRFFNPEEGGCSISQDTPNLWDLTEKPRFTPDEVAQALEIVHVFGREDTIRRTDAGVLCYGSIILNQILFPSILPGQSVTIADTIKDENEKEK